MTDLCSFCAQDAYTERARTHGLGGYEVLLIEASATRVQRIDGPHKVCDLRRVQYTCPEALILSKVGSVCEREEVEGGRGGKKGREIEEGLEGELREHERQNETSPFPHDTQPF